MSSENNNCLENNADQVNERERINLNGFGAETAFSELAYALEYEGREAIGKQTFFHERLPLLITHVLDIKSDGRSEGTTIDHNHITLLSILDNNSVCPCFQQRYRSG